MRTCKRCKTNEAVKGSLNCEKCNERNRKHTAKMTADSKAKILHIPVVSKEKELPGWLETLYNVNPGLAERAEKYIDTVWNEAIDTAANNIKVIKNENTSQILSNLIDKQSILNTINQVE